MLSGDGRLSKRRVARVMKGLFGLPISPASVCDPLAFLVEAGAVPVDIPATLGFERGAWFRIRQGSQGILTPDEQGIAVVHMVRVPATHHYQVMTRSTRMLPLIDEHI